MALIISNASLRALNTLKINSTAHGLTQPNSLLELTQALECLQTKTWQDSAILLLGGGSNIVFIDDYPGVVIMPQWSKIETVDETSEYRSVRVGAGHNWHELVLWHLQEGLSGLENMALIPGRVGAAPIQNIGAYGVELADCCQSVEIFDITTGHSNQLSAADCQFQYRNSLFKSPAAKNWLITHVTLKLNKQLQPVLTYPGLSSYLEKSVAKQRLNAKEIAKAVCHIRQQKLPDPTVIGNVGSFFKNPIISTQAASLLLEKYPEMPQWPIKSETTDTVKISAAWLIEQAGWKGKTDGDIGVYPQHALVLVNYGNGNASGKDLWAFAQRIQTSVCDQFNVMLEPEPRVIGL